VESLTLVTAADALALLRALGANAWLVRHHELVLETGEALLDGIPERELRLLDRERVLIGCALHDVGKVVHRSEMAGPGHMHEEAGRDLLLRRGLPERIARFCVTHARWRGPDVQTEDLLVALSDHLWKGKRAVELEEEVMRRVASVTMRDFWAVYPDMDTLFEHVASRASDRLARSNV
jgi:hypothetical protein